MKGADNINQPIIAQYRKKQPVHLNLEQTNKMYEIVSGGIKLYGVSPTGEEVLIDLAISGDFIGGYSHKCTSHVEYITALVDTKIRVHHLLNKTIENQLDDPIVIKYVTNLSERAARYQCRLMNNCSSSASLRLRYVYRLYDLQLKDSFGIPFRLIDLLSNKDIGNLSGVARQTVKKYSKRLLSTL